MNQNYKAQLFPGQTINTINIPSLDVNVNSIKNMILRNSGDDCYTFTEKNALSKYPQIIFCKTWKELIGTCFPNLEAECENGHFFGFALLNQFSKEFEDRKKALADFLGINIDYWNNDKYSYALVRMDYTIGTYDLKDGKEDEILENFVHNIPDYILGDDDETKFKNKETALDVVSNLIGTHLIKSVDIGEHVFQIFVYDKDNFDIVSNREWDDYKAFDFPYFIQKCYCESIGSIKTLSGTDIFNGKDKELFDDIFSHSKSIFKILDSNDHTLLDCIENITEAIPLHVKLTSCVVKKGTQKYDWLKEASIQARIARFGVECVGAPYSIPDDKINYKNLYSNFYNQETITSIWAPFHSISQLYVNLGEIVDSQKIINLSDVKNLVVTADVIEIPHNLDLSYFDNIVLGCRLLIAGGKTETIPSIKISDNAYTAKKNDSGKLEGRLTIYCQEMVGNCFFYVDKDYEKRKFIYGNLALSIIFDNSQNIVVYKDFFAGKFPIDSFSIPINKNDTKPSNDVDAWIKETLKTGIQMLLFSASVPVSPYLIGNNNNSKNESSFDPKTLAIESYKCINWAFNYIQEIAQAFEKTVPPDISSLYAFAVQVMDKSVDPNMAPKDYELNIPRINYKAELMEDDITILLELAETYSKNLEGIRDDIKKIYDKQKEEYVQAKRDQNIKAIADFLIGQNQANVEKEQEITEKLDDLINTKTDSLNELKDKKKELGSDLDKCNSELSSAKDALIKACTNAQKEKEEQEIIDFANSLVACIYGALSISTAFAAASELPKACQSVEKFIKVADAFKNSVDYIQNIEDSVQQGIKVKDLVAYGKYKKNLDIERAPAPTDAEWEIFFNESTGQVKNLESYYKDNTELECSVNNYCAKLGNLIAVGKSLNNVREKIRQWEIEIFADTLNKEIAQDQADRLSNLQIHITDLDTNWHCDQDYLSDLGMMQIFLQQKANKVMLKLIEVARIYNEAMSYYYMIEPCPINKLDIASVKEMFIQASDKAKAAFSVQGRQPSDLKDPIEIKLSDVPVNQIMGKGYDFTIDMDKYPVFDSYARVRINYIDMRVTGVHTDKRQSADHSECNIVLASFGNPMKDRSFQEDPSQKGKNLVLSYKTLPDIKNVIYDIDHNKTIKDTKPASEFEDFFIKETPFQQFRVSVTPNNKENINLHFEKDVTDVIIKFYIQIIYIINNKSKENKDVLKNDNPYEFLQGLKNTSISNGWDAVNFITIDAINNLWKKRWENEINDYYSGDKRFSQQVYFEKKTDNFFSRLDMCLGAPLLTFKAQEKDNIDVKIPIMHAYLSITQDQDVQEFKFESTKENTCYLTMQYTMQTSLKGSVDDKGQVFIKVDENTFRATDIKIEPLLENELLVAILDAIKENDFKPWLLGKIKNQAEVDYLKPKQFFFNAYHSDNANNPDVLGIYILTNNNPPLQEMSKTWGDDAWVVGKDCNTAVYSELLWNKALQPNLVANFGNIDHMEASFFGDRIFTDYYKWHDDYDMEIIMPENFRVKLIQKLDNYCLACDAFWRAECFFDADDIRIGFIADITYNFNSNIVPLLNTESFEIQFQKFDVNPEISGNLIDDPDDPDTLSFDYYMDDAINNMTDDTISRLTNIKNELEKTQMPLFAMSNILFPEDKMFIPEKISFIAGMAIVGNTPKQS